MPLLPLLLPLLVGQRELLLLLVGMWTGPLLLQLLLLLLQMLMRLWEQWELLLLGRWMGLLMLPLRRQRDLPPGMCWAMLAWAAWAL